MATPGSPCPSRPFLAAGQGCGSERPHGLPPPLFRPRGPRASGRMAGRGAERRLATPPGPAFSRAAADHWALAAPARLLGCAQLQPNSACSACSSTAPARFQPGSSPAPARLRFVSATPLCEPLARENPGSLLSVPLSLDVPRTTATSRPPKSPRPALLTSQPRHTPPPFLSRCPSVCPPPRPPFPSSLQLPRLVFLGRRCGAALQENPRNLCKKLTMKFKKFYDFGASVTVCSDPET